MDRPSDMLHYIQTGLERQGYSGCLSWKGIDRYREAPPTSDDWEIDPETGTVTALMFGKDWCFRITIEETLDFAHIHATDAPAHSTTAQ